MTIQQLEYFLSAAKTLNFTKTGEDFFISQSAVTQQIRNLEQELKVSLFYRQNKKLALTPAGKIFISEAEGIISQTKLAFERVRAAQAGKTGELNIGYLKCMEMSRFPKSVQNFHHQYPGVHLNLKRDNAVTLHDDFLQGRYDIIFTIAHSLLTYPPDVHTTLLRPYSYFVVTAPDNPLNRKSIINQDDLANEKLIIHDFQRGSLGAAESLPPGCLRPELLNNVIITDDDVETILIMVASGAAVAILPDFDVERPQVNLNLMYTPLDTEGYTPYLQICYWDDTQNPLLPLFLEYV